jgi:hypothetical protein
VNWVARTLGIGWNRRDINEHILLKGGFENSLRLGWVQDCRRFEPWAHPHVSSLHPTLHFPLL